MKGVVQIVDFHILGIRTKLIYPQETIPACAIQNDGLVFFMHFVHFFECFYLFSKDILHP